MHANERKALIVSAERYVRVLTYIFVHIWPGAARRPWLPLPGDGGLPVSENGSARKHIVRSATNT